MNRREAVKLLVMAAGVSSLGLATGCNDQTVIAGLLTEMESAWQALETSLGKTLPANISDLFAKAVTAVQGWVPGTAVQGVIEVLQDLSTVLGDVEQYIPSLTALEAAAAQIILGTVINLIEIIDPAAVPTAAMIGSKRLRAKLLAIAKTTAPQKHFRAGEIKPEVLKKKFELEWSSQTGRKAA